MGTTKEEALAYEIGVRQNYENITDEGWEIIVDALLKQVPKKPIYDGYEDIGSTCFDAYICPTCGKRFLSIYKNECCPCGQCIDWE